MKYATLTAKFILMAQTIFHTETAVIPVFAKIMAVSGVQPMNAVSTNMSFFWYIVAFIYKYKVYFFFIRLLFFLKCSVFLSKLPCIFFMACFLGVEGCEYNGQVYPYGKRNIPHGDGCNTCACEHGGHFWCSTKVCGK